MWLAVILATAGGGAATATAATTSSRLPPIIYRPAALSTARSVPLLIALHGASASPAAMQTITGMDKVADEHGFVVAYLASADPAHAWSPATDDLQYVNSMIDQLVLSQNIDPSRVYVTGFSAGGYEAWSLGCTYSSKIAGIAIVANNMNLQLFESCALTRPLSEYLLVGSADGIRDPGIPGKLPSAAETNARWQQFDGCTSAPAANAIQPNVSEQTSSGCNDGSSVALTVINGGLHNWPGGPTISTTPDPASAAYDASEAIWAFLSAHALSPSTLTASLLSVGANGGTSRSITASFRLGQSVKVATSLDGSGAPVPLQSTDLPGGGSVRLRVPVPSRLAGGVYGITLKLVDGYDRQQTITGSVTVPAYVAPPPPKKPGKAKKPPRYWWGIAFGWG